MGYLNHTILSWVLFLPTIGGGVILLARSHRAVRWTAFIFSLATFLLSLHLPFHFDSAQTGYQFVQNKAWIPAFQIHYFLGIDGISLWLLPLTTLLTFLGVLVSWKGIQHNVKAFYFLLLILETGMLGVFASLDLFLFYVFWEVSLVPMALLIGIWGHENRIYAAVKFFLYTMAGSLLMLACIVWLYNLTGTFSFPGILAGLRAGTFHIPAGTEMWLFLGFFIAFAIKVPLFPFHTWLPDAHVEAPTAGSVLLAGVLLKMGAYGLLRFNLTLFPRAAQRAAHWIVILGLIGLIYGALVAFSQKNMKKLVAYSSVSHMGLIIVGVFTFTAIGTQGAVYQMLNHGVSTAGLFILVGMLFERRHTFDLSEYGGIATAMPIYAGFFLLMVMSSVGLPPLNGFVGEFLLMLGAFVARHGYGIAAAVGVIVSAMYLLKWTRDTLWGEIKRPANLSLADLDFREGFVLGVLGVLVLVMGFASPLFLNKMSTATRANLAPYAAQARPEANRLAELFVAPPPARLPAPAPGGRR